MVADLTGCVDAYAGMTGMRKFSSERRSCAGIREPGMLYLAPAEGHRGAERASLQGCSAHTTDRCDFACLQAAMAVLSPSP